MTYDQLKNNLIKEFGRTVNRQEIYQILRRRSKKPDESVRRYVIEMESIALRSDISDFELVVFIQEGLQNKISDFILFAARNIDDINDVVNIYEQRQCVRGFDLSSIRPAKLTSENKSQSSEEIRCYNYSKIGHIKLNCPYEKRPVGVCFNCCER